MIPRKQRMVFLQLLFEFLLLNTCLFFVLYFKNPELLPAIGQSISLWEALELSMIFNGVWGGIILFNREQEFYSSENLSGRIKNILMSAFLFIGITSTVAIIFKIEYFNRTTFLLPIFLFSFLNIFFLSLLLEIYKRKNHQVFGSSVLLVGIGDNIDRILDFQMQMQNAGYGFIGALDNRLRKDQQLNILGEVKELPEVLERRLVDEIFITGTAINKEELQEVVHTADYHGVRVNLIPETILMASNNFKSYQLNGLPLLKHRQTPLDNFSNFLFKKVFDFLFALSVLILLSPLMLLIALLIYMDGKGPIFYMPMRKGEGGKTFRCYKFRTMSVCDHPVNGTQSTVRNDPRITPIGKYLRKFDLDELPQFFNVLKGDMSVVGPRPHRVNLHHDFRRIVNDYMVRHYVKPGITGWAQVNGWRGPTETVEQKKGRIEHDLWYIENWNPLLDIKIIFLTVFGRKTRINAF